jgi:hypothetical protein
MGRNMDKDKLFSFCWCLQSFRELLHDLKGLRLLSCAHAACSCRRVAIVAVPTLSWGINV